MFETFTERANVKIDPEVCDHFACFQAAVTILVLRSYMCSSEMNLYCQPVYQHLKVSDTCIFFQIKCVVMGFDKYYSYNKMLKATAYLGQKDCLFVATNTDAFLPMGGGRNLPGRCKLQSLQAASTFQRIERHSFDMNAPYSLVRLTTGTGSLVFGVEVAAQRKAIICGKPEKPIIDVLVKEQGVDPSKTIMIGDRYSVNPSAT